MRTRSIEIWFQDVDDFGNWLAMNEVYADINDRGSAGTISVSNGMFVFGRWKLRRNGNISVSLEAAVEEVR